MKRLLLYIVIDFVVAFVVGNFFNDAFVGFLAIVSCVMIELTVEFIRWMFS